MSKVDDFIKMHFKALLQTELQSQSLELLKQPCCFVVIIFFANNNDILNLHKITGVSSCTYCPPYLLSLVEDAVCFVPCVNVEQRTRG